MKKHLVFLIQPKNKHSIDFLATIHSEEIKEK